MKVIIILALLLLVTYVNCYGRLKRTYEGQVCGGTKDPKSLWYEEVNAASCSGVGTTNCTTIQIPPLHINDYESSIATCATDVSELQMYVSNTSYYYWTTTAYANEQCDGAIKSQRYTGSIVSSCVQSKTAGKYYKHVCNKDGEMTLTSCSDEFCSKCSGVVTLTLDCVATPYGSSKLGCTACPTCANGATQMTVSVGVLLLALLAYLF